MRVVAVRARAARPSGQRAYECNGVVCIRHWWCGIITMWWCFGCIPPLYNKALVSMDEEGGFVPEYSTGFIQTLSTRLKASKAREALAEK